MYKYFLASLCVLFLNLAWILPSSACPYCPYPVPSPPPPPKEVPCPPPPKAKPPPSPPKVKPPPSPPKVKPPPPPKVVPPSPPKVIPPPPPKVLPPPPPKVIPPPPPKEPTCPINTLKLDACVDLLGGLIPIGIGSEATDTCCPVLSGVADLDAALCLCTVIKAKLLNINILLPIALEVLLDCGKHLPSDYQCPA